jgi:DGQHR domain-containing protein
LHKEEGIDSYLGIQRELDQKRVKEIRQYVTGLDATFPTSVVLSVPEDCVVLKDCGSDIFFELTLSNKLPTEEDAGVLYRQIARVIDGQHRIEGLRDYKGPDFEVNLSIFIGADIADQASIFSIVNLAQTKVNRSLVYDLFELSKSRSPERTCHEIVVSLDQLPNSPFYRRIKRLGTATEGRFGETLSQATVVSGILQYISGDKLQVLRDRQTGRKGRRFPEVDPTEARKVVLRPLFVRGQDPQIGELIWRYFDAVKYRWPKAWESSGAGNMLNRTNGFNGLMRLFRPVYLYLASPGEMVDGDDFYKVFEKSTLKDEDFNTDAFVPGTSGATKLYHTLAEQLSVADVK